MNSETVATAPIGLRRMQRVGSVLPRLLDIDDAARYLATSDKTVRALIANGELGFIQRIPGRSPYLLDRIELDQWVNRNKRFATGAEPIREALPNRPDHRAEREG